MGSAWGAMPHKKWPFDSKNCRLESKLGQRECTCRFIYFYKRKKEEVMQCTCNKNKKEKKKKEIMLN